MYVAAWVAAVVSAAAGAIVALLPVMVLGVVTLFYNSAGGVLIFLGSLINLLPLSPGTSTGNSSLPILQQLTADANAVVVRSVVGVTLCSIAALTCSIAALTIVAADGKANRRIWFVVGLCCLLASIAGGRWVTLCVIPAIAISVGHLACQPMR